MTTSLPELLAAVPALNDPEKPYAYVVADDAIVGTWDIVRAASLHLTELTGVDKDYRITVTLDPDKGTFDFTEHYSSTEGSLSADDGRATAHGEKTFFSGKSTSKQFSFEFGGINKTDEGVSMAPVTYSFSTERIKEPLFTFLEQHGWHRKKGFLGGLFNR